jgi:cation-transporting ATPase E
MSTSSSSRSDAKHDKALAHVAWARQQLSEAFDDQLVISGLSSVEVETRRTLGLTNAQDKSSSRSLINILRSNLLTLFNAVVGGSFLLLLALGQWKDALFGFAVITNVVIGVVQEFRSKRALDRVAILHQPRARVLRGGVNIEIGMAQVVLDDVLVLRAGDQVPADAVVLRSNGLEVDESLLTGESDAIEKSERDLVLSGSSVVAGSALARTIRVGIESYSTAITLEARRFSLVSSELRNSLARIIRWITWALIPVMLIALNGQMQAAGGWPVAINTGTWVPAAVASIASIISMIPQGLVLITSITFALAAVKLARQQVLVQELPAVEGLARVDVVCFDKTGTLTEGEIEFDTAVELTDSPQSVGWRSALAWLANAEDANGTSRSLQTEFAATQREGTLTASVPFSSARKWSAIELDTAQTWVFGAPEMVLLEKSQSHSSALARAAEFAEQGLRTLVLAVSGNRIYDDQLPTNIRPTVLIALRERVRSDAPETIAYFLEQGLSLKVISGDNPRTVGAVANAAGIPNAANVVDARTLPDDVDALAEVLETHSVFGRVSPEQKKLMVLALQSRGHIVAMTGDGVNDALALKKADLGIAMGNGSAATKAVSRLVLIDSRFASLPSVVAEGRRVIANVERVSRLFLTKTSWAILLAIVFGVMLWPFPFLPRQLSAVDGYTIGIASFLLALLPNPRRYVAGFLKRSLMFCIPAGMLTGLLVIGADGYLRAVGGYTSAQTQTVIAVVLSLSGLWVLVALSRPLTGARLIIVVAMYAFFIGTFTIPLSRDFFGFVQIPESLLVVALTSGVLAILCIEAVDRIVTKMLSRSATGAHDAASSLL